MQSWLPLIFIVFAIAMAVGPVLMLKPSRYQQNIASLRSKALKVGLQVHSLPLKSSGDKLVPAYCLPWKKSSDDRKPWLLERRRFKHEVHFSGEWDWVESLQADDVWSAALKGVLDQLPESVLAVGNGPQGLCCFWSERGGEVTLDQLVEILRTLSASRG